MGIKSRVILKTCPLMDHIADAGKMMNHIPGIKKMVLKIKFLDLTRRTKWASTPPTSGTPHLTIAYNNMRGTSWFNIWRTLWVADLSNFKILACPPLMSRQALWTHQRKKPKKAEQKKPQRAIFFKMEYLLCKIFFHWIFFLCLH